MGGVGALFSRLSAVENKFLCCEVLILEPLSRREGSEEFMYRMRGAGCNPDCSSPGPGDV